MKSLLHRIPVVVNLGLAFSGIATFAQTGGTATPPANPPANRAATATPAPSTAPATAPGIDETVYMNPFEVDAASTVGYVASESSTGTRINTKIADLPFVVDVVTKDFLKDFNFTTPTGSLDVSSLSGLDTEGNNYLRGFASTFNLWNGFYSLGLTDPVNIERIEVIKGPNAGIYGQTSPSGMVNFITREASTDPYQDLTGTYGSFGTWRLEGHVDVAGTLGSTPIANLVGFAGMDTKGMDTASNAGGGEDIWAYNHERALQDAFKIKLDSHSTIIAEVNWLKKLENTGDDEMLFLYNSATSTYTGQPAPISLARFSQGGPNERQNREMTNFHVEYRNQINDVWSLRIGGYGYDRHNSEIYNGISNEFDPNLGEVVGISTKPTRTILNEDGGAGQADLLAHYFLFNHTVNNTTLFTLDYSQNWRFRRGTTLPTTLTALLPSVQNPNDPNYNTVPDYPAWTVVNRDDKIRWDTDGAYFADQAKLLNDRLILYASMRHDQVTYNLDFGNQYSNKAPFAIATPGQVQHFVDSAWSPAGGANYKLTPNIALYANYSQSFEASAQSAKLGSQPLPNTRGDGGDYGIKGNFLNNHLQFTIGGYYVTETGIKITETLPDGSTESVAGGSQNSKGVEFDSTYQVSSDLALGAGFGYVDARLLNEGTDTQADGRRPPFVPIDNGYVYARYGLNRWIPGLSAVARYEYTGVSYPDTTATTTNEWSLRLPAYFKVDTGLRYQWTKNAFHTKITESISFFVNNLLNADYVNSLGDPEPERSFYVSYEIQH